MKWGLLIYSMKSLLQTRTECYSRSADGRILNFHSELSFLLRFPNTYTVPLNHHAVTNVGPTRYWNENGWHYVGICRACWAKDVGPTSNQPLAIMSARWQKWHLANDIWTSLLLRFTNTYCIHVLGCRLLKWRLSITTPNWMFYKHIIVQFI